ncbi:hypothetical protein M378DRAFT_167553 [Amanita muscaria Koide BX008]|uniref:Uncharacterized protein n=1 Tax=Amanita muscaria (strain Koide BX008) TaxID=946122 RepID=A0A0C2WWZ0_AMAMK|nr:hypothetical protein M378DRAFT_167553 [Amanita muscaria Koide BX008]
MVESFTPQSTASSAVEVCGSTTMGSARPRPRADQLGLRGLEALMDRRSDNGDEYVGSGLAADGSDHARQQQPLSSSHKKPVLDINDQVQRRPPPPPPPPQQHQQQSQQSRTNTHHYLGYGPRYTDGRYYMMDELHIYPDDASVYCQGYNESPRPDAPISPTPQGAAPSPSPLMMRTRLS